MKPFTTSPDKSENINTANQILAELNIEARFSGYSDTNGVSVYFKDSFDNKIRISNHSVGNRRLQEGLMLSFDDKYMNGSVKSNMSINKIKTERFYN